MQYQPIGRLRLGMISGERRNKTAPLATTSEKDAALLGCNPVLLQGHMRQQRLFEKFLFAFYILNTK